MKAFTILLMASANHLPPQELGVLRAITCKPDCKMKATSTAMLCLEPSRNNTPQQFYNKQATLMHGFTHFKAGFPKKKDSTAFYARVNSIKSRKVLT
jgi:hypothetical protein